MAPSRIHAVRESTMGTMVVMQCQCQLFQVLVTLQTARRTAHRLHGGKEQSNQQSDNGDHHKQFSQSEPVTLLSGKNAA